MKTFKNIISPVLLFSAIVLLSGCSGCGSGGDFQGREYMPDMAHSIAYEANYLSYYDFNTWSTKEELKQWSQPRKPVNGTIPRGYAGVMNSTNKEKALDKLKGDAIPLSGSVPYHFPNTEEGLAQASASILSNPYAATEDHINNGKELYTIYCGVCHGKKGDGNGPLWNEGEGPYPNAPTNYLQEEYYNASEGRYYHAIMHGKGVMGSYADKLSYEERWDVIHYIRSLQAKAQGSAYGVSNQVIQQEETSSNIEIQHSTEGETHESTGDHGDDHGMNHNEENS